jgi:succinate dehydrogenase / fumarate reductase, cytochrome b subunit
MQTSERPLSPHLQIYRWQLTMTLSIAHRATGIALSVGTLLLIWWLVAAASGPDPYAAVQSFMRSWLGILFLLGWSFSLFYHLCNGIRHLVWDTGYGLDIKSVYQSGWTVVVASLGLTILAWGAALAQMGRG